VPVQPTPSEADQGVARQYAPRAVADLFAVESRPARSGGGVPVQPTPSEADQGVARQYAPRAVADLFADERVRSLGPLDAMPEADPKMAPFPLRGPDAAASVAARPDPGPARATASGLPAPLSSAVSFAAAASTAGEAAAGAATAAAGPPVRNDAGDPSVSWAVADDARLAALARGGDAPPAEPLEIEIPLGGRAWERSLGERVVWLVGQQLQAAEIRLNPPHLGPVEVRLTVSGSEASLSFGTPHAPVREAIEQALPRLREQLAEQHLVLVSVDVGDRGVFGQAAGRHLPQETAHSRSVAAPEAPAAGPTPGRGHSRGLVDEYA
jgi:hypothetical protein